MMPDPAVALTHLHGRQRHMLSVPAAVLSTEECLAAGHNPAVRAWQVPVAVWLCGKGQPSWAWPVQAVPLSVEACLAQGLTPAVWDCLTAAWLQVPQLLPTRHHPCASRLRCLQPQRCPACPFRPCASGRMR